MQKDLVIRKADLKDIDTIRFLAESIWPETYKDILSKDQIDYMMNLLNSVDSLKMQMEKDIFLLAHLNEEPVGFASYSETTASGIYKLNKIYVKTRIHGRGIGRELINFVLDKLKALHGVALELNVNRNNKAKEFYLKLGFRVIREEDIDIGQGYYMNDYVMRLNIGK